MTIQAYKLGSLGQDSVAGTKILASRPVGDNYYMTFEYPVGTDYAVTAGYTFYITKLDLHGVGSSTAEAQIGYGDDGVASGAAAPTNAVILTEAYYVLNTDPTREFDVIIPIPASKYPFVKSRVAAGVQVTVYGIEIAD